MIKTKVDTKTDIIDFPLKIILTEEGIRFFIKHNKKLNKIRTADNQLEYGCILENISILYLTKMIKFYYISKIEINSIRLNEKRNNILRITSLILEELLISKLNETIFKNILNTSFIRNWNRINPTKCIDDKTKFNYLHIMNIIKKNKDKIVNIQNTILNTCMLFVQNDITISNKEIANRIILSDRLLDGIKSNIWYLILKLMTTKDFYPVINFINKTLYEFIEKTKITDYFSHILLELLNSAENLKIEKFVKKYYRNTNVGEILYKKELREKILLKMESKEEHVNLIWKIKNISNSIGNDYKMKVLILNKEYDYKIIKDEIESNKNIPNNKRTLFDLYKENPDNIGMMYLSYLDDACKKLNIKFESSVNRILFDDMPTISLSLNYK